METEQYLQKINEQTDSAKFEELVQEILGEGGFYDECDKNDKALLLDAIENKQEKFYGKIEAIKGGSKRARAYFAK